MIVSKKTTENTTKVFTTKTNVVLKTLITLKIEKQGGNVKMK